MAALRVAPKTFARRYRQSAKELLKPTMDLPHDLQPETIHDLRVAARRTLVMRRLLSRRTRKSPDSKIFDLSLKSLLKATSRVRDLDILTMTLGTDRASLPDDLFKSLEDERSLAATGARAAIRVISKAPPAAISPSEIDDKKLSRRLRRRVETRAQSVKDMLGAVLDDESKVKELHALRIAVKKLRYLLELADGNPPEASVVAEWQDSLGWIHDLDVAESYVQSSRWNFAKESALHELRRRRHQGYLRFVRKYREDLARRLKKSRILGKSASY